MIAVGKGCLDFAKIGDQEHAFAGDFDHEFELLSFLDVLSVELRRNLNSHRITETSIIVLGRDVKQASRFFVAFQLALHHSVELVSVAFEAGRTFEVFGDVERGSGCMRITAVIEKKPPPANQPREDNEPDNDLPYFKA
jgi:hypothetical protein